MLKVETYQSIKEKKRADKVEKQLSTEDAMIRSLDFLDFRLHFNIIIPIKLKWKVALIGLIYKSLEMMINEIREALKTTCSELINYPEAEPSRY